MADGIGLRIIHSIRGGGGEASAVDEPDHKRGAGVADQAIGSSPFGARRGGAGYSNRDTVVRGMEKISVGKLVGMSDPGRWSQVHVFVPEGGRKEDWGSLIVAMSVGKREEAGHDLAAFGQEIIQRLHEEYYGLEAGNLAGLRLVLERVRGEFSQVELEVGVGVIKDVGEKRAFYAAGGGGGKVVLVRGGQVFEIAAGASGWLEPGDVAVVGTKTLFELIAMEDWREVGSEAVEVVVERLAPLLVKGKAIEAGLTAASAGVVVKIPGVAERMESVITEVSAPSVNSVASVIRGIFGRLRWPRRQGAMYVGPRDKKKWVRVGVAMGLGSLLLVSVVLGWRKQRADQGVKSLGAAQEVVGGKIEEGKSLTELNPLRARVILGEAKQTVDEYQQGKKLNKRERIWVDEVTKELTELIQISSRIYEIKEPVTWLDLNLVREGSRGEVMDLVEGQVLILDRGNGIVLRVSLSKSAGVVGGGSLVAGAKLITGLQGRGLVWGDKGIVEVNLDQKTTAVAAEPDEQWGEVVDIKGFSGNTYLLDKGKSQIWKHVGEAGKFGAATAWFKPGVKPDLSEAMAMAIDGSVWMVTRTGKVVKYARGSPEAFEITGLDEPLREPERMYTDADSQRLYILDKGNRRVVVVDKSGEYQAQYRWEGMDQVTDMVVAEAAKKILLLAGNLVYEIELR